MGFFRKLVKNILPYYVLKKYQAYMGGTIISRDYNSIKSDIEEIKNQNKILSSNYDSIKSNIEEIKNLNNILSSEIIHRNNWIRNEQIKPSWISLYEANSAFAPGNFYSPIPSIKELEGSNFNDLQSKKVLGIDLNDEGQMLLLNSFETFYKDLPFTDEKSPEMRYYYKNGSYSYSDAIFLYFMVRHLKPRKLIEVGSGFSSCVTLDTNEIFMENSIDCIFIEPYPALLESLLKKDDKENITIHKKRLQEMPIDLFKELNENDILFIDSTHVSKFNSDVNYVLHEILPVLAHGVHIHFHDVFYPFEYPREWLFEGRAWNEQYILRAFLEYNKEFKIVLFNTYLQKKYKEKIINYFPLLYKNTGGSIWIKKI